MATSRRGSPHRPELPRNRPAREPERWDEDGFDESAADDDGEYGFGGYLLDDDGGGFEGFDDVGDDAQDDSSGADNTFIEDFDGFDSFDEDDGFDDEIDRDGF